MSPPFRPGAVSGRLPEFPWDQLDALRERARAHPGGIVDLSIGTPVDPTPRVVQEALGAAADSPGYPQVVGLPETRRACLDWLARRAGVTGLGPESVLPVIGSKELISSLPGQLGLGAGHVVAYPELAYPTYEVGALVAGAAAVASDEPDVGAGVGEVPHLLWVNSPSNPTGRVLGPERLRELVRRCRAQGTLLVSDECYLECAWDATPVSVLHPEVSGGSSEGLLAVHSLSKRSNLAGYRCGFVAGDPAVVGELLAVRKHLGLMMPGPQQAAMVAALDDDDHVLEQHARYAARRALLREALERCGFRIDHSEAALYLWASRVVDGRGEDCWDTLAWLAERGILVAPGSFYGAAGRAHVRVAITATDERVAAAAARLAA